MSKIHIEKRLEKFKEKLTSLSLKGALITSNINFQYLMGFQIISSQHISEVIDSVNRINFDIDPVNPVQIGERHQMVHKLLRPAHPVFLLEMVHPLDRINRIDRINLLRFNHVRKNH